MERDPVGLTVKLVPAELEPLETFVDGIERNLGVPFEVSIVDAKNYRAAVLASVEPVEDESSRAANVKVPGRRRRKTDACHTKRRIAESDGGTESAALIWSPGLVGTWMIRRGGKLVLRFQTRRAFSGTNL